MTLSEIIDLLNSDQYDNDIWLKIDHIQAATNFEYSTEELLDIYDNQ